jgi:segregation and condensation protein A
VLALPMAKGNTTAPNYVIAPLRLYSIEESAVRLRRLLGVSPEWGVLQTFLPEMRQDERPLERRSALASTFAATLELVRNGELELRQEVLFGPITVRRSSTFLNS